MIWKMTESRHTPTLKPKEQIYLMLNHYFHSLKFSQFIIFTTPLPFIWSVIENVPL